MLNIHNIFVTSHTVYAVVLLLQYSVIFSILLLVVCIFIPSHFPWCFNIFAWTRIKEYAFNLELLNVGLDQHVTNRYNKFAKCAERYIQICMDIYQ